MSASLYHRGICVQDIDISCQFYIEAMGFFLVEPKTEISGLEAKFYTGEENTEFYRAVLRTNTDQRFQLMQFVTPESTGPRQKKPLNNLGLTHLSFNCEDFEATCKAIASNKGKVYSHTRAYYDVSDCTMIYATDPDGVRLELMDWTNHATGFSHSGICVADLEPSITFYQTLGFNRGDLYDLTDGLEWLDAINEMKDTRLQAQMLPNSDNDVIELLRYHNPATPQSSYTVKPLHSYGYNHLAFRVDQLQHYAEKLESCGGHWLHEPTDYNGVKYIHGVDPSGVRLLLIETS